MNLQNISLPDGVVFLVFVIIVFCVAVRYAFRDKRRRLGDYFEIRVPTYEVKARDGTPIPVWFCRPSAFLATFQGSLRKLDDSGYRRLDRTEIQCLQNTPNFKEKFSVLAETIIWPEQGLHKKKTSFTILTYMPNPSRDEATELSDYLPLMPYHQLPYFMPEGLYFAVLGIRETSSLASAKPSNAVAVAR